MSEREQLATALATHLLAVLPTHWDYVEIQRRAKELLAASPAAPSGKLAELRDAANWMWQQSARKDIGPSRREAFELSARRLDAALAGDKQQRIAASLEAVNAPQPTELSTAEWKEIVEGEPGGGKG